MTKQRFFKNFDIVGYQNLRLQGKRSLRVRIIGPCVIKEISKSSVVVEDLITHITSRQHLSHVVEFKFGHINPLPRNWNKQILSEIYGDNPRQSIRLRELQHGPTEDQDNHEENDPLKYPIYQLTIL